MVEWDVFWEVWNEEFLYYEVKLFYDVYCVFEVLIILFDDFKVFIFNFKFSKFMKIICFMIGFCGDV